ncbi:MAG TPA: LPS export ABC transporter permease LptG [Steroidobacteraceae bacterium]|nr:LPS export ABC transporter permease LptG [Steroidobacteraceae bacterium]
MNTIDRYILRAVLFATALTMSVFLIMAVLITFIGEQGDVGQGRYTSLSAFWYAVLMLPGQAWALLPIGALIGSLLGLGQLARGSELIVLRASGVSVARIAGSVLIAGFVLLAAELVLGELLAPSLEQAAKQEKALARFSNASFGSGGAWVRDGDLILDVVGLSAAEQAAGMLVFELSPQHHLIAIGDAARARAGPKGEWILSRYRESRFTPSGVVLASSSPKHELASHVTAEFLNLAAASPQDLGARALWTVIQYDRANALDATAYLFAFWSRIARTVAIVFAVLLGIPFVLGVLRTAAAGSRMLIGILIGLGFFFLQRLIESGTIVFDLNPIVLAWLPTALLAAVTLVLLVRAR